MRIKYSNPSLASIECPQQKLKNISCTQEVFRSRSFLPVTPQRSKKEGWVFDAWEIQEQREATPEKNVLRKQQDNNSIRKSESKKDRYDENAVFYTPQTVKNQPLQKENKYRGRLYSQVRSRNKIECEVEEISIFKKPITSIVYPIGRDALKEKGRRIDRFHSFLARSIRK